MARTASRNAADAVPEPASFPGAFAYEHSDIPIGMTLADYRRERDRQARKRTVRSVLRGRAGALLPSSWRPEDGR